MGRLLKIFKPENTQHVYRKPVDFAQNSHFLSGNIFNPKFTKN
jgi:hypothetical protein